MKNLKHILPIFLVLFFTSVSLADSIRISQIDSNSLLLNQQIKLYISVTDDNGEPITSLQKSNFRLFESSNNRKYQPIDEILNFQKGINYADGVSFLLLLDNSESMYWTMEGEKTKDTKQMRMTVAQKAIKSFLSSIRNPNDKVGVAAYNSYYTALSKPIQDMVLVEQQLQTIERPTGDAIYTEIYASLNLAVDEFKTLKGRKALIILSDGVNNPSYKHTKTINQQFGEKYISYQKPLESLQREGISLYVVNFGKKGEKKDRHLVRIAKLSGGMTFNAYNQRELQQVYFRIMNQIQKEYIITYPATMEPADKKFVKTQYLNGPQKKSSIRFYYAASVFGQPQKSFNPLIFISLLLAAILLFLLSKVKFEKQRSKPSIEVLNAGAGKISTQILTLDTGETIIGSAPNADMTIAGVPAVEENHATIVFDEKTKQYNLKGRGKMLVNNKLITTKVLEPGDLINIDGTTMIFDEGAEEDEKE